MRITTILYPEWIEQQKSPSFSIIREETPLIHVFGSFFDSISFSFLLEFIPSLTKAITNWDKALDPQLLIIFLPISQNSTVNTHFKTLLDHFVDFLVPPPSLTVSMKQWLQDQIFHITSKAHSRFQQLYPPSSLIQFPNSPFLPRKINEYCFGSITADFLTSFPILPVVFIGSRLYNGIPLNYSLTEFVKKLLAEDVLEEFMQGRELMLKANGGN